jgi:nucleoside-diphosphate-sugar epimerase
VKVVVTGASGFIGTNVVERWVRRGHLVVGLDDLSRPDAGRNAAHLAGACGVPVRRLDIADQVAVDDLIASERPDVVVHLPRRSPSPPRSPTRSGTSPSTRWAH